METRIYRSRDGQHLFHFEFVKDEDGFIVLYCRRHPSLLERDPNVHLTHLFSDGRICISTEFRPITQRRAEALAAIWAEHFLRYRKGELSIPDFSHPASE